MYSPWREWKSIVVTGFEVPGQVRVYMYDSGEDEEGCNELLRMSLLGRRKH